VAISRRISSPIYQVEYPDHWLKFPDPWEVARPREVVQVPFGCSFKLEDGRVRARFLVNRPCCWASLTIARCWVTGAAI
jgi:hypothetical protein